MQASSTETPYSLLSFIPAHELTAFVPRWGTSVGAKGKLRMEYHFLKDARWKDKIILLANTIPYQTEVIEYIYLKLQ